MSLVGGTNIESVDARREPVQTWDSHVTIVALEAERSARLLFYAGFGAPLLWGISALLFWPQIRKDSESLTSNLVVKKFASTSLLLFLVATLACMCWFIIYWSHGELVLGVGTFESLRVSEESVNFYLSL